MAANWTKTWLPPLVAVIGLPIAGLAAFLTYITVNSKTLHPNPQEVKSITRSAPLPGPTSQPNERDSSDADAWFFSGIALEAAGQGQAAMDVARRFLEKDPLSPMAGSVQLVSLLDAMEGRTTEVLATLRTMAEVTFDAHITFLLSESYAAAGDSGNALRLLELAVTRGFYPAAYISVHCPFFQSIRGTAEFDRIAAIAARRAAEFRA